jgi:hypothetical protein
MDMIKKPVAESVRNRAIYWLGSTPESQAKNAFLADLVRNQRETSEARQQAMSALAMSKAAATLPLLEQMYALPRELDDAEQGASLRDWLLPHMSHESHRKGERIVLLTTQKDAERPAMQRQAKTVGASELAVPADIRVVGTVPLLGSGKTDYVGATTLANELATPAETVQQQKVAQQEVA